MPFSRRWAGRPSDLLLIKALKCLRVSKLVVLDYLVASAILVQFLANASQAVVVKGITSGQAALTDLCVPLTHCDHAQGMLIINGHGQPSA